MRAERRPSDGRPDTTTTAIIEWPWRRSDRGVTVRVRLTPRSSKSAVDGIGQAADGPALLVRVNAVPEDNAANNALTELVASWLECPKRSVELVSGGKSRVKILAVSGDPDEIEKRLLAKSATLDRGRDKRGRASR